MGGVWQCNVHSNETTDRQASGQFCPLPFSPVSLDLVFLFKNISKREIFTPPPTVVVIVVVLVVFLFSHFLKMKLKEEDVEQRSY